MLHACGHGKAVGELLLLSLPALPSLHALQSPAGGSGGKEHSILAAKTLGVEPLVKVRRHLPFISNAVCFCSWWLEFGLVFEAQLDVVY